MKKAKVRPLTNNGDFKLPNGRYSKNHEKVFINISVFRQHQIGCEMKQLLTFNWFCPCDMLRNMSNVCNLITLPNMKIC